MTLLSLLSDQKAEPGTRLRADLRPAGTAPRALSGQRGQRQTRSGRRARARWVVVREATLRERAAVTRVLG